MTAAVILAAGDGKRMKSKKQKVCCRVLFKPMLCWVLDSCKAAGIDEANTCAVISDDPRGVPELLSEKVKTAVQAERRGTGHAVLCAKDFLDEMKANGVSHVAVLCGDAPFVSAEVLSSALEYHKQNGNAVTVITAELLDPARYGRIIRSQSGDFLEIVEAADASPEQLAVREINSGSYWFSVDFLLSHLPLLQAENAQGEYYLTDMISLARKDSLAVGAFVCGDTSVVLGANDRTALAQLNEIARQRIIAQHRLNGVDIPISDGIMIGPDVTIGCDTTVLPGTILCGKTEIGEGCTVGPNSRIIDCVIGDDCNIDSSRLEQSEVGSGVRIGPFAQLRPNSKIADKVKIGNFVEIKNSTVGEKTSFAHLTYIGDSDFGARINVGCGVVTVNYDGKGKYRTTVGDDAFIGCNSNLIAPVTVENGAYVAAATTVTENVPADAMTIGRVRQSFYPGYALRWRKKK